MATFEDFKKLELKVGKILEAANHPNADRLFVVKVDVGEPEPRQLVAGIRGHYEAEQLVGKRVVVVANLDPKELRGVQSNGMILAATDAVTGAVTVVTPDRDTPPGSRVS